MGFFSVVLEVLEFMYIFFLSYIYSILTLNFGMRKSTEYSAKWLKIVEQHADRYIVKAVTVFNFEKSTLKKNKT